MSIKSTKQDIKTPEILKENKKKQLLDFFFEYVTNQFDKNYKEIDIRGHYHSQFITHITIKYFVGVGFSVTFEKPTEILILEDLIYCSKCGENYGKSDVHKHYEFPELNVMIDEILNCLYPLGGTFELIKFHSSNSLKIARKIVIFKKDFIK
jgi:hypothetical protein